MVALVKAGSRKFIQCTVFSTNAKKVKICKYMFGGFADKIKQCVEKSGSIW